VPEVRALKRLLEELGYLLAFLLVIAGTVLVVAVAIPVVLMALAVLAVVVGYFWFASSRRKQAPGWSPPADGVTIDVRPEAPAPSALPPAILPPVLSEGWPMTGADPQRSRRSRSHGARRGRLAWHWTPEVTDPCVSETLVAPDPSAIVVNWYGSKRYVLTVLSPQGRPLREIALPHPPWSEAHFGPGNNIYVTSWGLLLARSLDGQPLWEKQLPGYASNLCRTPSGALLCSTKEAGFALYTDGGEDRGACYPGLKKWLSGASELKLAFDAAGNLYTALSDSYRGSPDEYSEQFREIAAFDPEGRRRWGRALTAPTSTDDPEYTVKHIWGMQDSAIFFGDCKIQSYSAPGHLLWEIKNPKDFERVVKVPGLELSLAYDRRFAGGPMLAAAYERGWELLTAAVDGEGNSYVCQPFTVASLDPELRLRWTVRLPKEHLYNPVIGPCGTVLVTSYGSVYALE
jgi:hypothetical protein